jgi:hypothetical protein
MGDESSEEKKSIGVALIQNTPLAVIIIGIFLTVLGAAGGWPKYGIQITELGWKIAICCMGLLAVGVGVMLHQQRGVLGGAKMDPAKYRIKFFSPQMNQEVGKQVDITGTYKSMPEKGVEIWLFEFSPTSQKYYPKRPVITNGDGQWKSDACELRGNPGVRRELVVATVGPAGRALCEYFRTVGEQTKDWVGIRTLTPDSDICDRITVKVKS